MSAIFLRATFNHPPSRKPEPHVRLGLSGRGFNRAKALRSIYLCNSFAVALIGPPPLLPKRSYPGAWPFPAAATCRTPPLTGACGPFSQNRIAGEQIGRAHV